MKQDEIAGKIALYLASEMHARVLPDSTIFIVSKRFESGIDAIKCISAELAAAIAPHLEAGAGWEDAPEWAEWRTVDGNGDITYWKDKPEPSKRNDYWTLARGDRYEQIPHTVKDWKETLQERPR